MWTRIMLLPLALVAVPSLAQTPAAPPAATAAEEELVKVALETSAGRIVLALDKGRAPVTTTNFLHYIDSGKLNGESFYRAMPLSKGGLIQGGITSDSRKLAAPIAHEPVTQTGIKHVAGTISMPNTGPGTARSDFFILTADVPYFDQSFAAFGRVIEGMDVVERILASPVSPTKGTGAMVGQMLEPAVKITKAERVDP